ncbi:E3 ubiquitin-protein ligase TRIM71-like, partial [Amphiura filiformis]|uniref:E3 ubiquitin-protein ligase TRIM71-like n=1 Tax=Amphiura filiformis TaxID=82378 RepID=UPI003B213EED
CGLGEDAKSGNQLTCPLCNEISRLPKTGVDGLKTNFLINKLKERKSVLEKLNKPKIPCTNCETRDTEAIARCMECRDFLCDKCLHAHKEMRVLKAHVLCTLEQVRSGEVDIFNTRQTEDTCDKHKGQVLRFFCKTCWVPTCRDCTVIEHCRPKHENISLDKIHQEQKDQIEQLATACQSVALRVDRAIEKANRIQCDLNEAAKHAQGQVDEAAKQSLDNFKLQLQVKCRKPTQKIDDWKQNRTKDIESKQQSLKFQQARLRTAIEMAYQVTGMGSTTDVAHVYSELTTTLDQLRELKPVSVQSSMGKIKFTPTEKYKTMATSLGELSLGLEAGHWELEKNLVVGREQEGVNDVAVTHDGEIVLTTAKSEACASISDARRNSFKADFKPTFCRRGHNAIVMLNGHICTSDMTDNVKVFGHDGKELFKFYSVPPITTSIGWSSVSSAERCIAGLAVNSRGEILVGEIMGKFISKHQQNGDHIASFELPIEPMYIAVAETASGASMDHEERIIVSSSKQHAVVIVNSSGKVCHTLARPSGVKQLNWEPTGVCFSNHGEGTIFVSNNAQGEDVDLTGFLANSGFAVYCYSGAGEYLNCVTTQVVYPKGLALMEDEEKLLVADEEGVKIFHLK